MDQLSVLLPGQQGGQATDQKVHLDNPVPVLRQIEPGLVHLPQGDLAKKSTRQRQC